MRLEQNHRPCAVISTTLPCTSVNKAKADAFPARLQLEKASQTHTLVSEPPVGHPSTGTAAAPRLLTRSAGVAGVHSHVHLPDGEG